MKPKLILCLALVLRGDLLGCSTGSNVEKPQVSEYKTIQRFDYPSLNKDNNFSLQYAFSWKKQLSIYEQQGWSVDSVSVNERKLASGQTIQSAIIVLKRAKK